MPGSEPSSRYSGYETMEAQLLSQELRHFLPVLDRSSLICMKSATIRHEIKRSKYTII
jgi:hypothetical protein